MRKAEQKVWDAMKRAAKKHAPKLWLQRVENLAGDGMPDVYAEGPWVELKAGKIPKRIGTQFQMGEGIRQSQINWHKKALSRGVKSYVLIRAEEQKSAPLLIDGALAGWINGSTFSDLQINALAIGWESIFKELTK